MNLTERTLERARKLGWRFAVILAFILAMSVARPGMAQVKTEVPPVIPSAKAVTVEHIKIHGEALEGNLEGDAAFRSHRGTSSVISVFEVLNFFT